MPSSRRSRARPASSSRTAELLRLNYIASNGKPYTPVGRWLIDQGIISREDMSMDKIREYMEANPKEGEALRLKNRSYVFFTETSLGANDECLGSQGMPLTPGRSLAVDPSIHVYGTPIWVEAEFPINGLAPVDPFHHLMFAQDTGSAIKGPARADIYFGHGDDVEHIAGRIKQYGHFVMLVPKTVYGERHARGRRSLRCRRPRPPRNRPGAGSDRVDQARRALSHGRDGNGRRVLSTTSACSGPPSPNRLRRCAKAPSGDGSRR